MISKILGSPMRLAAVSVLLVALFCIAVLALSGCAGGKLKLPDLGDMKVNDLVQTGGETKQYKTEVDVSIKSDLDNIPEVSVSSGSDQKSYTITDSTPTAPTPTPEIGPGEPTKPPDKTPEKPTPKPTMGPVRPKPKPTTTPSPAPTYSLPTPGTEAYIEGKAIVTVTGSEVPPDAEHDKGAIFSLDGPGCESAWVRHRNKDGKPHFQVKGVGDTQYEDHCWGECNYYDMKTCVDGDWQVEWFIESGHTEIRFTLPNGNMEQIRVPNVLAFNKISPGLGECVIPRVQSQTTAVPKAFVGTQVGKSTGC